VATNAFMTPVFLSYKLLCRTKLLQIMRTNPLYRRENQQWLVTLKVTATTKSTTAFCILGQFLW